MYNKTIINTLTTNEKFMNNVAMFLTKDYDFTGEYWDAVRNYVTMVQKLQQAGGYKNIQEEINFQFESNNYPTRDNDRMRNSIIKFSPKKVFLCMNYKDVRSDVFTALSGADYVDTANAACRNCKQPTGKCTRCKYSKLPQQRPVIVVGNIWKQGFLTITSLEQWAGLLEEEAMQKRNYAMDAERRRDVEYLLAQRTKWLPVANLKELLDRFNNFGAFMEYIQFVVEDIESQGQWDTELPVTRSFIDGQKLYTGLVKDGKEKGQRALIYHDNEKTFDSYVTTDADWITQFLSLTFYVASGMMPMVKIAYTPDEEAPGYLKPVVDDFNDWDADAQYFKASELHTTPIYASQSADTVWYRREVSSRYDNIGRKLTTYEYNNDCVYDLPELR